MTPFGDGFLCVAAPVERVHPPIFADAAGAVERPLDLAAPPVLGNAFPGATSNFQFWYRDPAMGASGFNLSDALRVVWE